MTKTHLVTEPEQQAALAISAKFADLERLHLFGNKMALYDAVALSNELQVGLPTWAVKSIQQTIFEDWAHRPTKWKGEPASAPKAVDGSNAEHALLWEQLNAQREVGYLALLKSYVRAKVYRRAMLWVTDICNFYLQPTRTIELWFDGKIAQPESAEDALKITEEGLVGTVAHCGVDTLRDFVSSDHLSAIERLTFSNVELNEHFEMSPKEYAAMQRSQMRDYLQIPFDFGYSETEIIFGLRKKGQFWGPKRHPTKKVIALLASCSADASMSSGEDF